MDPKKRFFWFGPLFEEVGDIINFEVANVIASDSPFIKGTPKGLILANEDLTSQVERLNSADIVAAVKVEKFIFALGGSVLYFSQDNGDTFVQINSINTPSYGVTNAQALEVLGDTVYITGDNGIWTAGFDLSNWTQANNTSLVFTMVKALGSDDLQTCRVFFAQKTEGTFDKFHYSDDKGATLNESATAAGLTFKVGTIRAYRGGFVLGFNGRESFSTDFGLNFTAFANFPAGSSYSDFLFLPNGRLVVTHSTDGAVQSANGIYYTDDGLVAGANFTQVLSSVRVLNVESLTNRVVVTTIDDGTYNSIDNAETFQKEPTPLFGDKAGALASDNLTYIVNELQQLTYDDCENFITEEIPDPFQVGNARVWFDSTIKSNFTFTNFNAVSTLDDRTPFKSDAAAIDLEPVYIENLSNGLNTICNDSQMEGIATPSDTDIDEAFKGGGTMFWAVTVFGTGDLNSGRLFDKVNIGFFTSDDQGSTCSLRLTAPSSGATYSFGSLNTAITYRDLIIISLDWDSDQAGASPGGLVPKLYINNVQQTFNQLGGTGTVNLDTGNAFSVGGRTGGLVSANIDLYEFIYFKDLLDTAKRTQIFDYLKARFDINNLPSLQCLPVHSGQSVLWYDASYSPGHVLSGSDITNLQDISATGNLLTTDNGTVELISAGQNGLDLARFNSQDRMTIIKNATINNKWIDGATVFMAVKVDALTAAFGFIFDKFVWKIGFMNELDNTIILEWLHSADSEASVYRFETLFNTIKFGDAVIFSLSWDGSTPSIAPIFHQYNVPYVMQQTDGSGTIDDDSSEDLDVMNNKLANRGVTGDLYEVVFYKNILTDANRTLVHDHLATKWGITNPNAVPLESGDLRLWIDIDERSSVIGVTTDGSPIPEVRDKSGHDNKLLSALLQNRPSWQVAEKNGKDVARFRESPDIDFFKLTNNTDIENLFTGGCTIFAALKPDAFTASRGNLFNKNQWQIYLGDQSGSNSTLSMEILTSGTSYIYKVQTERIILTQPVIFSWDFDSDNLGTVPNFYKNNTQHTVITATTGTGTAASDSGSDFRWIANSSDADGLDVDFYEFLFFKGVLTAQNRTDVFNYLSGKWSIA